MTNYLNNKHFKEIAPTGAKLKRLSGKAMEYETETEKGVIYCNTVVFKESLETGKITLNSGGRETNTTKKRINHGLRGVYTITQRNFIRYVGRHIPHIIDEEVEFYDGIEL